ncbi:hypothetical protein Tsubulata_012999 [Turnera subulata]|uniref:non-specific serine/threonine protein kinase n=1 Tax=Turnera subulata TaxID=218843 RepID=A0A9Q0J4K6_9ROSI|nr:hypothetical protein Tsubulata_012999 [Turnera subulata]
MGKRLRKPRTICSCKSPRLSYDKTPRSFFNCFSKSAAKQILDDRFSYEEDLWTEVAKHLDGKSLVKLAATCHWFHEVIMHDSIWRFACLRDLRVPAPSQVSFKWIKLYASLADGTHSYMFRDTDKHLGESIRLPLRLRLLVALLTEKPKLPLKIRNQDPVEKTLESLGACMLTNIKKGIWIADLQLVRCPVCESDICEGTMQTLDTRHMELFLCEGFQDGSWKYEEIGSYKVNGTATAASGAIFDLKHLRSREVTGIFDLKSWAGKPDEFQPKAIITYHSVAISTNLQANQADSCSNTKCRRDGVPVRFPFYLEGNQSQSCGHPGFNLRCNDQGFTVLELPYSGNFLVRSINYRTQQIQLYDSEDCLARRLLNFNLSGSPFLTASYFNYTFLSCPSQFVNSRFTYIACLSNSTTSVIATSSTSLVNSLSSLCQIVTTFPVPASWKVNRDEGFTSKLNKDLKLAWDSPDCIKCEVKGIMCGFLGNGSQQIGCFPPKRGQSHSAIHILKIVCIYIVLPTILSGVGITIFIYFTNQSCRINAANARLRNSTISAASPQPIIAVIGLDESAIESYKKVVLGESKRLPGRNDSTCAICLSEYRSKETVRCIPECHHCFHADCIDEWLRLNRACPVCRNLPSPAHV